MMDDTAAYRRGNKAAWDASAPAHGSGEGWEKLLADAALPGFSELDETLTATLRSLDLKGKRAVQVCCNNARELLSLPSLGIEPVLGIDQSAAFLAQGAALSAAAGRDLWLVEADVYALPEGLGTYDLALITIGILNWMPDMPGFFRAVAGLVAPGGRLVIYETHPILEMVDPEGEDPHALAFSYFDKDPIEVPEMIVYDGAPTVASGAMGYWFVHTMGEIVTACIAAGFVLERLEEHPHSNREPDYDKYEGQEAQLPLCYTLVARRAGA